MSLIIIFKRFILINLKISLYFVISPFLIDESLKVRYFNNSIEVSDNFFYFAMTWIIGFFISLYMLYNFKKPGKQIFLCLLIASLVLSFFSGPIASDPIFYILDGLSMAINGALLFILYYTPISKKF